MLIFGIVGELVEEFTDDTEIRSELYNETDGCRSVIRMMDVEFDEVIQIKRFPSQGMAAAEFAEIKRYAAM